MQPDSKDQIIIDSNKLYIQDTTRNQKFSIKNISQKFVYVRIILSNNDNYMLNKSQMILQPNQEFTISIKIKMYDKISKFNFVKNRIFIVYLVPEKQMSSQKIDFNKELKNLKFKQINIEVNCKNIRDIHQQTRIKLKKIAKITRYNKNSLTQAQFSKIQRVCQKMGEIVQIIDAQSLMLIRFSQSIQMTPRLFIGKDYFFTISYLSTHTGKQDIKISKQKKLPIYAITNLFTFEQLIICYNKNYLLLMNSMNSERKQFLLEKNEKVFSSKRFICIVINDEYIKIFQRTEKIVITKVQIRYLKISYLCQFNEAMYVSGVNHNKSFNEQNNQLFLIQKFNLKKAVIIPDQKIIINQEDLNIQKFMVYKNSLIIYSKKVFYIYSLRKKQIIVKIKKEILEIDLLLGKQSYNYINFIGRNSKNKLFFINIQKYGQQTYGSEVFQYEKNIQAFCQSLSGRIYLAINNIIYQYFVKSRDIQPQIIYKTPEEAHIKFIKSINQNVLVVYLETKQSSWLTFVKDLQNKSQDHDLSTQ